MKYTRALCWETGTKNNILIHKTVDSFIERKVYDILRILFSIQRSIMGGLGEY